MWKVLILVRGQTRKWASPWRPPFWNYILCIRAGENCDMKASLLRRAYAETSLETLQLLIQLCKVEVLSEIATFPLKTTKRLLPTSTIPVRMEKRIPGPIPRKAGSTTNVATAPSTCWNMLSKQMLIIRAVVAAKWSKIVYFNDWNLFTSWLHKQ